MLLIPTYVAPSLIEGVGVFADEDIAAGTLIWRLDRRLDRLFHADEIADLSDTEKQFITRYGYTYPHDPRVTVIEMDNGRFMNHAAKPNTDFTDPDAGYARIAIRAHEELTCNYAEFEPEFEMLPGRNFTVPAAFDSQPVNR